MGTFINQSVGNSSSLRLIQKKNRPEKFPFTITLKLNVLTVQWSVKCPFALNSPIFRTSTAEAQQQDRQLQSIRHFKQTQ